MNILVTGANGQLGNELRLLASDWSASVGFPDGNPHFLFTDVVDASEESLDTLRRLGSSSVDTSTSHLDITDLEAVRTLVSSEKIDVIINCAAYTNVDAAESDPERAELLNAKAPENLAIAMKEVNGLLIHISTDYVFGGDPYNTPCREEQTGTPTGIYGLTKLHGEQAILTVGCQHVILRTAWLYSEFGRNFLRTMLNLTATKQHLSVVFDQTGTPTYARDLADAILAVIADYAVTLSATAVSASSAWPRCGIYHYSNEGVCSWYDFTVAIAQMADHNACDIQPCHSDEFPSPVKRPAYSVLDKTKVKQTFHVSIPYWTDSLRSCIANIHNVNSLKSK